MLGNGTERYIICTDLFKIYKVADLEVVALRGLDLVVAPGEVVAIVGASGSGKTTLLNILAGYDTPSAGGVEVGGRDLLSMDSKEVEDYRQKEVGFVWQQTSRNLFPYLTALENVALWHERDISHSSSERLILPDACMALDYILSLFTGVMQGLKVYPERMMANIESTRGVVFSQRVLLELVANGLSREKAYDVTQRNALRSWDENLDFRQLLREEPDVTGVLSVQALDKLFDYGYYTRYVGETFERVGI
mgnify:CR=1 FL=1